MSLDMDLHADSDISMTRRRKYLLAQMYETYLRGALRGGVKGATVWGAIYNKHAIMAMHDDALVQIHDHPGEKPYLLVTLTPSGIEEARAALATLILAGEREPSATQTTRVPDWMTYSRDNEG